MKITPPPTPHRAPTAVGGDLSGSTATPVVSGLGGTPLDTTTPTTGQILTFNGTNWVPTTASTSSPLTTKGDLFGFDTADAKIPVGSNGQVLTADSTDAQGVSWQTPSGSSGVPAGTSFPGSPSTNDLYFRTDRHLLYYYDGTQWLTTTLFEGQLAVMDSLINYGATTVNTIRRLTFSTTFQEYLVDLRCSTFVNGTNTGSAFWTVQANSFAGADVKTTIGAVPSFTTAADSGLTWTSHIVSLNTALATTARGLHLGITKTSTPGNLLVLAQITFRLIG